MVAEGRFAPLPSLVLFWRSLDREVPVDSILNINNMASGLHIFHLGFFLIPLIFPILYAGVVELADTRDLKSLSSNTVPVRARSPAPEFSRLRVEPGEFFVTYQLSCVGGDAGIAPYNEIAGHANSDFTIIYCAA